VDFTCTLETPPIAYAEFYLHHVEAALYGAVPLPPAIRVSIHLERDGRPFDCAEVGGADSGFQFRFELPPGTCLYRSHQLRFRVRVQHAVGYYIQARIQGLVRSVPSVPHDMAPASMS
jgi:hypothetical protein